MADATRDTERSSVTDRMVEVALETYAAAMLGDVNGYRNEPAWLEASDAMRAALVAAQGVATTVDAVWCEHTEQVRSLPTVSRWWCDPLLPDCPGPHRTLLIGVGEHRLQDHQEAPDQESS